MEVERKLYTSWVNIELLLNRLISVVYKKTKLWTNTASASPYKSLDSVVWFSYKSGSAHLHCKEFLRN